MTFDQYANQGDTSAWDPEAAAATKRAADKIFNGEPDDTAPDQNASDETVSHEDETNEDEVGAVKQDPHPPGEVPDPDLTRDP